MNGGHFFFPHNTMVYFKKYTYSVQLTNNSM